MRRQVPEPMPPCWARAIDGMREFCVNELCTALHGYAHWSNGRPGNSLKYKASGDPTRD